jgi:hypothetical protein
VCVCVCVIDGCHCVSHDAGVLMEIGNNDGNALRVVDTALTALGFFCLCIRFLLPLH